MGIALVIAGGLVLMTLFASMFSYLGEKKKRLDPKVEERLALIEHRLEALESKSLEKDDRLAQLASEVTFVSRLIEERKG